MKSKNQSGVGAGTGRVRDTGDAADPRPVVGTRPGKSVGVESNGSAGGGNPLRGSRFHGGDALVASWHALRANPLRSLLTSLSVALGAGAIAVMLSIASSALSTILSGIDAVGGREIVFLEPKKPAEPTAQQVAERITLADADALRLRVPGLRELLYLDQVRDQPLVAGGTKTDVDLAVGRGFMRLLHYSIRYGTEPDWSGDADGAKAPSRGERWIVLSEAVAEKLFGTPEAAVGKEVTLWNARYQVVAVAALSDKLGFNMGGVSKDRVVFLPIRSLAERDGWEPDGFVLMRSDGTVSHDLQMRIASAVMRFRHRGVADFEFFDLEGFIDKFDKVFAGLKVLVVLIASVSLLIAGAGVMNVLMASIRQRVTEVGIRRAIGASREDIRWQFLIEAVVLSASGGCVGSVVGVGLALLVGVVAGQMVPGWVSDPSWVGAGLGVVAAAGTGLVFGLRPARMASEQDIVGCLRGEI